MSSTVLNLVDGETILRLLNREVPSAQKRSERILRFIAREGKISEKELQKLFHDEVASCFRTPVDQWLRTGVDAGGVESPRSRTIVREHAMHGVFQYFAMHPPAVSLGAEGLSVFIGEPPEVPNDWTEFFQNAATEANRLLVGLVLSDWRFNIFKCRYCECYYLNPKPRASYLGGTYCSAEHRKSAYAERITAEKRDAAKCGREIVAAKYLVERGVTTSEWHKDAKLKSRVAAAVSIHMAKDPNLCSGRYQVRPHWVSRNCEQIEARRRAFFTSQKTQ